VCNEILKMSHNMTVIPAFSLAYSLVLKGGYRP